MRLKTKKKKIMTMFNISTAIKILYAIVYYIQKYINEDKFSNFDDT